ncbi:sugar phosphate isomerase/epimerase family protein [Agromyces bauzanensis]
MPDHDIPAAAAAVRAEGFTGIEWRVEPRPNSIPDPTPAHPFLRDHRATIPLDVEAARATSAITTDAGLELIGLGAYVEPGDEETLAKVFAMAVAAGAPMVRMQAPRPRRTGRSYGELFARTRDFLPLVERIARDTGVTALIEIHHMTIAPSPALVHRLIHDLDPRDVGAIYDTGNLVWEGYEDPGISLDLLGPHLRHVHLKNAAYHRIDGTWEPYWSPLDDGLVDVPAFVELLRDAGYDGWISVEELRLDLPPTEALRYNGERLRTWGLL